MRLLLTFSALLLACGDDGSDPCVSASDCPTGAACVDGECTPRADSGLDAGDAADARTDAAPCPEPCDGECVAGVCCALDAVCGDVCCSSGEVCSFLRCVMPGATCRSEDDCADGEYCEPQLGETDDTCAGAPVSTGRCLPRPPICPDGTLPDPNEPECVASCTFLPEADAFAVEERFAWGAYDGDPLPPNVDDVRNSPIVIQLDDDDCDGRITGRDVPEIVVITSPDDGDRPDGSNAIGDLVVLGIDGGALVEKWRAPRIANPWTYPAAGNVDAMAGNEIVVCNVARDRAVAYGLDADGLVVRWTSDPLPSSCSMPSIADFDQDGTPEVLVGGTVLSGADGTVRFTLEETSSFAIASDVDGDPEGRLEVIDGRRVMRLAGTSFSVIADSGFPSSYPLVADLDPGGLPEIVSVHTGTHTMTVWRLDGSGGVEVLRSGLDINGSLDPTRCPISSNGRTMGGGPPTAADVNGDEVPDIAVAGGVGYAVFDGARLVDGVSSDAATFFWVQDTVDCSSARTGSSVFDFNGDGLAEVLYADEHTFRIYEGMTGAVLFSVCNTNGTILEMPVVADVDNDGQADVVVAANARYRSCLSDPTERVSGIRVYSSPSGSWVRTRRVWNQHAYHVTNVEEDGSIPTREPRNWETPGLNNFRQNKQPDSELAAVDAVVSMACSRDVTGMTVTVRNLGQAVMPAGAEVRLVAGTPGSPGAEIGRATTTRALFPAQAEDLNIPAPDDVITGTSPSHATVVLPPDVQECRTDNNVTDEIRRGCLI